MAIVGDPLDLLVRVEKKCHGIYEACTKVIAYYHVICSYFIRLFWWKELVEISANPAFSIWHQIQYMGEVCKLILKSQFLHWKP